MPRREFIVLARSVGLLLGLWLLAAATQAIEIELEGARLPPGPFTLFAAPGEFLVLRLPDGTANTQLYLEGVGAGQRKSGRWTLQAPLEPGRYALQINDQVSLERRLLSLWVGRPASEHLDRTVALSCGAGGTCSARLGLAPGAWMLRLSGAVDGRPYRRDLRMWLSGDGQARME